MEMNRTQRRAAAKMKRAGYGQTKHSTRVIVDPVSFAVNGVKPMRDELRVETELKHRQAFEAIRTGSATALHARYLVEMVNMTEIHLDQIETDELMRLTVDRAKAAIESAKERYKRTQRIGFSGPEMQDVSECLDLHERLIKVMPVAAIERTIKEYGRRAKKLSKN